MTLRFRPARLALATVVALGVGVPAALAATSAPPRSHLEPAATRPSDDVVPAAADDPAPAPTSDDVVPEAPETPDESATEVEHEAGDDRLAGEDDDDADEDDADVSRPCDEAEHAADPRCASSTATPAPARSVDDDRSGRDDDRDDDRTDDRSGRRGGDDRDDDRSGSSSGRG